MNRCATEQEKREGQPHNLEQMLDRLREDAEGKDKVSINSMMDAVGRRSFGPLILVVGLIAMSPLSGIPSLPSILGIMVALIAVQLLFGRRCFWLPKKILNRSISSSKFKKGLNALQPVGRFVDKVVKPRLCFMTRGTGSYVIALFVVVIGLSMPPLEILPFLATTAGAALTVFGLSLIAHDGILAILAIAISAGVLGWAVNNWLIA